MGMYTEFTFVGTPKKEYIDIFKNDTVDKENLIWDILPESFDKSRYEFFNTERYGMIPYGYFWGFEHDNIIEYSGYENIPVDERLSENTQYMYDVEANEYVFACNLKNYDNEIEKFLIMAEDLFERFTAYHLYEEWYKPIESIFIDGVTLL